MKTMKISKNLNEQGLVSIIVTIIVMMILGLIVLGFSRLTQRDERQTLDRQLNTQATYAAETGVNDVVQMINSGTTLSTKDTCANSGIYSTLQPDLDTAAGISYTCVLIDPTPKLLTYQNVVPYKPRVVPVKSTSSDITTIRVAWENPDVQATTCTRQGSDADIPTQGGWGCKNAMLRIDLVPGNSVGSRASMLSDYMTFFVVPTTGAITTVNYNAGNRGAKVSGGCDSGLPTGGARICNIDINVSSLSQPTHYLRIQSLYQTSNIDVGARNGGTELELADAQALIDVTGKAQDVLKRIQVRKPLFPQSEATPISSILVGSTICKQMTVIPDTTNGVTENCGLPY